MEATEEIHSVSKDDVKVVNSMESDAAAQEPRDSESDTNTNDSDSDSDEVEVGEAAAVKMDVSPHDYNGHVELIKKLSSLGDHKRLREACETMNRVFPLSPELWLLWIEDECCESAKSKPEGRSYIEQLFERAVGDYLSVELWLEYVNFTIGYMSECDGSVEKVRSVFEKAMVAAGLHISKGVLLWESYREFEMIVLRTMVSQIEGENKDLAEQLKRVANLFKRQLSVPLLNMDKSYSEFEKWVDIFKDKWIEASGKPDTLPVERSNVDLVYKKALERLHQLEPYENILGSCEEKDKVSHYKEYLKFEQSFGDPVRLMSLFERAVSDCPLDAPLWLGYVEFLDGMHLGDKVLETCRRSIRNCPWYSLLWQQYIRTLEKCSKSHDEIENVFHEALQSGMQTAEDYRNLWIEFCAYLRRRIKWGSHEEGALLSEFRDNINAGCEHLDQQFGQEGDPACELLRMLAAVEAIHSRLMDEARKAWTDIMNRGHKTLAASWLQYIHLEMAYGDSKHLRRLFPRALQSTSDWPESIVQEWLQFERIEGDIESYENAIFKCRSRMKEITAQREKQLTEVEGDGRHSTSSFHKKAQKKRKEETKPSNVQQNPPERAGQSELSRRALKRPASREDEKKLALAPPPGYKPDTSKKPKLDPVIDRGVVSEHDSSKDNRTVFVSNLDYSTESHRIREIFSSVGTITDLRLVKDFKGRSKGFCYVVFSTHEEMSEALKKDRVPIDGRPMFVSKCDPDKHTRQHGFRWSTNLERNKLFVRDLPLSTTKEDLEKLFEEFGRIKDVRLVIYRNGHFKGIAFVEFDSEAAAARAVLKVNGTTLGGKTISVEISHPPNRQTSLLSEQQESDAYFVRSLGGGARDLGGRGRGRTQVSFVPRALQMKSSENREDGSSTSVSNVSNGTPKPKNNADFRQLLLGNKE